MVGEFKSKRQEGFTIIEVLIVLAIAGLIMLIVFLAVPSLQRNARNNARQSDATLVVAAVNECLTNRNGLPASCQALGAQAVNIDLAKLNQLNTNPVFGAGTGSTTGTNVQFNTVCSADGTATGVGTARQFTVRWQAESTGAAQNRCIDS